MANRATSRRELLMTTAIWAGGALAAVHFLAPRRAAAFSIEEVPATSGLGLAYTNHCGPASEHAAMKVRMRSELARDSAAPSITEKCPICGCPVTVWR